MRPPYQTPGAENFSGGNQPLYVRVANTLRTGFFKQQYNLFMDHQQEDAVDGGAAGTTQFHELYGYVLNDNKANLTTTQFSFDSNQGVTGTANYVLSRRPRIKRGQI